MKRLSRGEYFGTHYNKLILDDCTITDTEYVHEKVEWHYHENPYFTYLIEGSVFEANKKQEYVLKPGSLLFHNCQEAHYNIKPPGYTRGFHIELNSSWFNMKDIDFNRFEGCIQLENPFIKGLMNKIFLESKINDTFSQLSVDALIVAIFDAFKYSGSELMSIKNPSWLKKLNELLIEGHVEMSLTMLSEELQIHPVHLSREFSKYFGSTFGQYARQMKLNKAILLINTGKFSMTEVCYMCGFYDQSHFTNAFRNFYGHTPLKVLKKIIQVKNLQF
ncbi:helix-turn-helix transcriptional regulator [Aureibacter tunicatorum]|uniref:AraC-like DNA-binding protein n=1 Tax=Aureibacter tunicatorum TaxID=866807 RepID=A0AAE3XMW8_9BACT|nr:helix-turn-helix transcriptional regulator [Aureibacter tunicatorum]MDR6238830.1 AraC-like DNA-binding protein [Aureibacter tunicatorum]BDD05243.1 AraC family transcriptional regulator [Aureibacter tunicatorum]